MRIGTGIGIPFQYNMPLTSLIAAMFQSGEQGAWYEPSDLTTLFQDSAGTTPVTAVEQPVGLVLDKRKGLVLGSELVTSTSPNTTNWSNTTTGVVVTDGSATWTSAASGARVDVSTTAAVVANKWYKVELVISSISAGAIRLTDNLGTTSRPDISSAGTSVFYILAADSTLRLRAVGTTTAVVTKLSVRELPGNHAYQSTSASRPVLSARVNLLTKTEQFDDAAWTKANGAITANAILAPDGTSTADLFVPTTTSATTTISAASATTTVAATYRQSVSFKPFGTTVRYVQLWFSGFANVDSFINVDLQTLTITRSNNVTNASVSAQSNGFLRAEFDFPCSARTATLTVGCIATGTTNRATNTFAGNGTDGFYIWGADLRVANTGVNLPAYQRVNTATDYATEGFPKYLKFDGVDDFLVTNSIDAGADKAQVFAGVRKLSDAAAGVISELSTNAAGSAGAFVLYVEPGSKYGFNTRGSAAPVVVQSSASYVVPITNIFTAIGDISGDLATIRINGSQAASSTADQGTGNYGAYPLYIGRRGGTTLPFNGHLYSLIVRFGSNLDTSAISSTETYVNTKTKAF